MGGTTAAKDGLARTEVAEVEGVWSLQRVVFGDSSCLETADCAFSQQQKTFAFHTRTMVRYKTYKPTLWAFTAVTALPSYNSLILNLLGQVPSSTGDRLSHPWRLLRSLAAQLEARQGRDRCLWSAPPRGGWNTLAAIDP